MASFLPLQIFGVNNFCSHSTKGKKIFIQCVIHSFFDDDGFELYLSTGFMFSLNILKDYQLLAMPNDGVLQGYECSSYFG